ncbi:phage tail assembly chaperone [Burkholderia vietnamiensis]|uniref:phage tail assembly chaperone n=1 Tax=Burkholderia vietnamiensis TaxID=60552 RepID=UPI00158BF598|nr:phage tail assembly chaperone [Burkholderia vietnamiensis]MCA8014386.1 phage tail assembly chaperone [Burkholderia vietnamiensis]HDR8939602.1 phage tail protein [Burkholderia vietnamiensis]HDR9262363.1 phage tail protein [Burkholderia vietnamiensis]
MGQKFASFDAEGKITGFYDSVDSPVPSGVQNVVEVTEAQWRELMSAQSRGARIAVSEQGRPVVLDPLPLTRAQIAEMKRAERDAALHATDWLVSRHQDEKLLGNGTTLTADEFELLLKYRQSLRECSDLPGWPNVSLPAPPLFATRGTAAVD